MTPTAICALFQTAQPDLGLGIGIGSGGLAALIFYFYRQERTSNQQLTERTFQALEANTQAMVQLSSAISGLEKRLEILERSNG